MQFFLVFPLSFPREIVYYSGKLSREKTFTVLWLFSKVFSVKFGAWRLLPQQKASNSWKFFLRKSYFLLVHESFLPRKFQLCDPYEFSSTCRKYWIFSVASYLAACSYLLTTCEISKISVFSTCPLLYTGQCDIIILQESRKREQSASINASLMKSTSTKLSSATRSTSPGQMAAVSTTSNTTKKVRTSGKYINAPNK